MLLFLFENRDTLELDYDSHHHDSLSISQIELQRIWWQLQGAGDIQEALTVFHRWLSVVKQERAKDLLGPMPEYVEALAKRLGKDVRVELEGGDTLMDGEVMRPILQSLTQIIRK